MLWLLLAACNDSILVKQGDGQEGDTPAECWDGEDNDNDGFVDCNDQDCLAFEECASVPQDTGIADTDDPTDTGDTQDTGDTSDSGDTGTDPNDQDGDGYTLASGDCNDLDAAVNPGESDDNVDGIDQQDV